MIAMNWRSLNSAKPAAPDMLVSDGVERFGGDWRVGGFLGGMWWALGGDEVMEQN